MFTLLLLAWLPMDRQEYTYVDQIEINTFVQSRIEEAGFKRQIVHHSTFDQIILWRWSKQHGRVVAQWKLLGSYDKEGVPTGERRISIWKNGKFTHVIVWEGGEVWMLRTQSFHMTVDIVDPKRKNREVLAAEKRQPYFSKHKGEEGGFENP